MAPQEKDPHLVRLELDGLGMGKVIVAGHDISHMTSGLLVWARAGEPTRVRITMLAPILSAQLMGRVDEEEATDGLAASPAEA